MITRDEVLKELNEDKRIIEKHFSFPIVGIVEEKTGAIRLCLEIPATSLCNGKTFTGRAFQPAPEPPAQGLVIEVKNTKGVKTLAYSMGAYAMGTFTGTNPHPLQIWGRKDADGLFGGGAIAFHWRCIETGVTSPGWGKQ